MYVYMDGHARISIVCKNFNLHHAGWQDGWSAYLSIVEVRRACLNVRAYLLHVKVVNLIDCFYSKYLNVRLN